MNSIIIIGLCLLSVLGFGQNFDGKSEPILNMNSPYGEDFLAISPDGKQLLFSRLNHPYNQDGRSDEGDIWISRFDSIWHVPSNFHAINDDAFSSPIGFSNDGGTILYNKVSNKGGSLVTEILAYHKGQKQILDIDYFNNKSTHQSACLSPDNRYMIISMQSGSSVGVEDLFFIKRNGDKWSAPRNLGTDINTNFQEITPFLSQDNKRLYFATNGRQGFGSFDIYVSERLDDTWKSWSKPINLGSQVNGMGRETSFIMNREESQAYFVSTKNSDGYGDVHSIRIQSDSMITQLDMDTTQFIKEIEILMVSGLRLINAKDSKPLAVLTDLVVGGQILTKSSNELGLIELREGLVGEIEVKGFMGSPFQTYADSLVEVRLEPLEVGRTIRLENVLFYRGKADIVESSFSELNEVVEMMKRNPEVKILLKGHTDGNGDAEQNLKLSQERVESAKRYLIKQGISKRRIDGIGLGGTEPIASNASEETRRLNRRVEFEIVE